MKMIILSTEDCSPENIGLRYTPKQWVQDRFDALEIKSGQVVNIFVNETETKYTITVFFEEVTKRQTAREILKESSIIA
jgi:hypothetical protein